MKRTLAPLSKAYGSVIQIRNRLFDKGVFEQKRYDVTLISVGNLSMGGTGKTPVVAHLVQQFKSSGRKVCIVSRGYGGSYKEEARRVDLETPQSAAVFGDEPTWFARYLKVPVYVGRERRKAVELCLSEQEVDVIVADDGFQHRWLGRDRDIVLLDATEKSPALIPAGRFREPLSSLQRAHYVLLTKTNLAGEELTKQWLSLVEEQGFSSSQGNLFVVDYTLKDFICANEKAHFQTGQNAFVASSIARPQSFEQMVSKEAKVLKHFIFKDHHQWTQQNIDEIKVVSRRQSCDVLVVTEKDYVKMAELDLKGLKVFVATLEINFHPPFPYENLFK